MLAHFLFFPCFSGIWSRRAPHIEDWVAYCSVLILVLVEFGLGVRGGKSKSWKLNRLNPCFSGIWSRSAEQAEQSDWCYGLNPCFSGIWSRSIKASKNSNDKIVLILVLVEFGLGAILHRRN